MSFIREWSISWRDVGNGLCHTLVVLEFLVVQEEQRIVGLTTDGMNRGDGGM